MYFALPGSHEAAGGEIGKQQCKQHKRGETMMVPRVAAPEIRARVPRCYSERECEQRKETAGKFMPQGSGRFAKGRRNPGPRRPNGVPQHRWQNDPGGCGAGRRRLGTALRRGWAPGCRGGCGRGGRVNSFKCGLCRQPGTPAQHAPKTDSVHADILRLRGFGSRSNTAAGKFGIVRSQPL